MLEFQGQSSYIKVKEIRSLTGIINTTDPFVKEITNLKIAFGHSFYEKIIDL